MEDKKAIQLANLLVGYFLFYGEDPMKMTAQELYDDCRDSLPMDRRSEVQLMPKKES